MLDIRVQLDGVPTYIVLPIPLKRAHILLSNRLRAGLGPYLRLIIAEPEPGLVRYNFGSDFGRWQLEHISDSESAVFIAIRNHDRGWSEMERYHIGLFVEWLERAVLPLEIDAAQTAPSSLTRDERIMAWHEQGLKPLDIQAKLKEEDITLATKTISNIISAGKNRKKRET